MIAFVLAGGARQREDLADLHAGAQAAQLTNLSMVDTFSALSAQRSARACQATGELRLLTEYLTGRSGSMAR